MTTIEVPVVSSCKQNRLRGGSTSVGLFTVVGRMCNRAVIPRKSFQKWLDVERFRTVKPDRIARILEA